MEKGGLWCGQYTKSWSVLGSRPGIHNPGASSLAHNTYVKKGKAPKRDGPDMNQLSIVRRQTVFQMIANMYSMANVESSGRSKSEANRDLGYPAAGLTQIACSRDYWNAKGEERRFRSLISAFDVDGPCLIATPYNPDWEILPRPELRSMSVCWVLEPKINGLWSDTSKVSIQNSTDVSPETYVETERKGKRKRCGSAAAMRKRRCREHAEDLMPAYQVLTKVKGSWQLMDLPSQEYVFS